MVRGFTVQCEGISSAYHPELLMARALSCKRAPQLLTQDSLGFTGRFVYAIRDAVKDMTTNADCPSRSISSSVPSLMPCAAEASSDLRDNLTTVPLPLEGCVPPRRRRRNLADIAWRHPSWAQAVAVTKRHWQPGTFYRISRVQMDKVGHLTSRDTLNWLAKATRGIPKAKLQLPARTP